jgi:hypothetical protein
MLRRGIGPHERIGDAPAHRADVDDAPFRAPQQRQEGLHRIHDAHHVDLEMLADGLRRQQRKRAGHRYAGIVDQPAETLVADSVFYQRCRFVDGIGIRHIEHERRERHAELALQPFGIPLAAHTAEHTVAAFAERRRAAVPNAS